MKLKFLILNLLGIFMLTALFIGVVYAETFIDNTQSEFDAGSYSNTAWNDDHVELSSGQANGTFTSGVFDAGGLANWNNIAWVPKRPTGKELPDNGVPETAYDSSNANMTGNVLLMHMNEASGTIVDTSGQGNSGTYNGASYSQTGKLNTALGFDGRDDYIDYGNHESLDMGTGNWTVEAWIKTTQSNKGTIFAKGGDNAGGIRYTLAIGEISAGNITLTTDDNVNKRQATGSILYNDNNWHHIVGLRDGNTLRVYVDGNPDGTQTLPSGYDLSGTSQRAAYSGAIADASTGALEKYFNGAIDEVAIYNRALSPAEVTDHYRRGALRLKFQVRSGAVYPPTGDFIGPGRTITDYYEWGATNSVSTPTFSLANNVDDNQYFQYQATLSSDDSGITPELSDVIITYSLLDVTAPAAVSDLSAVTPSDSEIFISWSAPGDDGSSGTATTYDLRYFTSSITDENWSSATQVNGEPTPSVAGSLESKTISGLLPNTTYYFAIKTSDEVPNESGLSNVASVSTLSRDIYISADSNSKTYGDSDPELTYIVTSGSLIDGDSFNGQLSRDSGENVGSYNILQGALSAGERYNIIFSGADFVISKRPVTVAAITDSKVYDGAVSSSKIPVITSGSLAEGDTASFIQSFGTADVGVEKILIPAGLVSDGNAGNNYEITFVNNATGIITSPPPPPPPPPPSGSGGGGGGSPPAPSLLINNESIKAPDVSENSITLTWKTNFISSSQVIYSIEGEQHSLDMSDNKGSPPKYGYTHTTPNYDTDKKVLAHSVTIYNLDPGINYYFRTVSHGSLAISWEYMIKTKSIGPEVPTEQVNKTEAIAGKVVQPETAQENNFSSDSGGPISAVTEEVKEGVSSSENTPAVISGKNEVMQNFTNNVQATPQNIILAAFSRIPGVGKIQTWILSNVVSIIILVVTILLICFPSIIIYRRKRK